MERALNKGSIVQSANVVNSNGAMKTAVAQDKQSIGYVGIGHVDKNVKALVFDKMVPSQENASNGTYKVTRLLFMNTKGAPKASPKPSSTTSTPLKALKSSKRAVISPPADNNRLAMKHGEEPASPHLSCPQYIHPLMNRSARPRAHWRWRPLLPPKKRTPTPPSTSSGKTGIRAR